MITKRTDSQGADYKNTRLQLLSNCLEQMQVIGIYQLNDHKGNLTVVWENKIDNYSMTKVEEFWNAFSEYNVEHVIRNTNQIFNDLYLYLKSKYNDNISISNDEIYVSHRTNLFDSMQQEFYGRLMEDEKLYKLAKKYSDNFYCEWHDNFNLKICKI
ncbi:hypothetical protein UFOVP1393_15 [uncultured Caudovirales phage]|uniref:Uncharacterized protein n=1 Tax=uncultured Caudovirales phage TaxID=2100421 RepID=A0A6J5S680_9CAUD|nr:hypothetical protein UFOVP1393_15 [uncultured Caudovirales phage]